MAATLRLFIAIELPSQLQAIVDNTLAELRKAVGSRSMRRVPAKNLNLTLKFLGDTSDSKLPDIESAMQQSVQSNAVFSMHIEGTGSFPDSCKPRVVWPGLQAKDDAMLRLKNSVEHYVSPLGYPTEKRAFTLHMTVGYVKSHIKDPDELARIGNIVDNVDFSCESA